MSGVIQVGLLFLMVEPEHNTEALLNIVGPMASFKFSKCNPNRIAHNHKIECNIGQLLWH